MKKVLFGISFFWLVTINISCNTKVENNPEKIAAVVIENLRSEEFDKMKVHCSDEGAMYVDGFVQMLKGIPWEKGLAQKGKTIHKLIKSKDVEPGDINVNENNADIKYRFRYDDSSSWQSLKMEFEKQDGIWKIVEFK